MDYEKEYKEALERAKGIHSFSSDIAEIKRMEQIFPALKESEDEKIRKALIRHIAKISTEIPVGALHRINGVDIPNILAWLEKQGEQKPYGQKEECFNCQFNYVGHCKGYCELKRQDKSTFDQCKQEGDKITTNPDGTHFNLSQLERVAKAETPEESLGISSEKYNEIVNECIFGAENKSRWTEEDEAHLHSITTHLGQWIERHPNTCGADIQCENLAWLESLKLRLQ